ncbi:MAG: DUF2249 domain-containing protein [Rhodocyclaceae bacterium]|nr:DUF2249 domain-containing protein [Rhodocyclaceae bacterium]
MIFDAFNKLPAGDAFLLENDHDPKPLYYPVPGRARSGLRMGLPRNRTGSGEGPHHQGLLRRSHGRRPPSTAFRCWCWGSPASSSAWAPACCGWAGRCRCPATELAALHGPLMVSGFFRHGDRPRARRGAGAALGLPLPTLASGAGGFLLIVGTPATVARRCLQQAARC